MKQANCRNNNNNNNNNNKQKNISLLIAFYFGFTSLNFTSAFAQVPAPQTSQPIAVPQSTMFDAGGTNNMCTAGTKGLVVADDREAATLGTEILQQGGNAIDAAIETVFAMSVTRPQYSTLGGGGFMVYCPAPYLDQNHNKIKPECTIVDFREVAPQAATKNMFISPDGKPLPELSQNGALASAIPGMTAGLLLALERFGSQKITRAQILEKPIALAKNGITVSSNTEAAAQKRWDKMNLSGKKIFSCDGKGLTPCKVGQTLKQTDLAAVLTEISQKGKAGFYEGWVAQKISSGLMSKGGIITTDDLKNYQPKLRAPIKGQFQDLEVITVPPPSSGGVALMQILEYMNIANKENLLQNGYGSAESIHALTHALSLAFADRAEFLGNADFVNVDVDALLNPKYLQYRWFTTFLKDRANLPKSAMKIDDSSNPHKANSTKSDLHLETTHLSVVDKWGNTVAMTVTLNDNFGSAFIPEGTGVVMNNIMDDFIIAPGVPNQFGLIGSDANAIAPGKKPLSAMTPTIIRDEQGNNLIALGAAGGPRIISTVSQILINRLIYKNTLADSLYMGRTHQQWMPDSVKIEKNAINTATKNQLLQMGYNVEEMYKIATAHALERNPKTGRVCGVPDTRGEGSAVAEKDVP